VTVHIYIDSTKIKEKEKRNTIGRTGGKWIIYETIAGSEENKSHNDFIVMNIVNEIADLVLE